MNNTVTIEPRPIGSAFVDPRPALRLPSEYQVGDLVVVFGRGATVDAVTFRHLKVAYDVKLDVGGETLRNVDSTFLSR